MALMLLFMLGLSCNRGPRETAPFPTKSPHPQNPVDIIDRDLHEVMVLDILPTERYAYLKVQEGPDSYWIASSNQKAEKGKSYFYREALLKTNFKSKETGKVFDTLYLVTRLVDREHALGAHVEK